MTTWINDQQRLEDLRVEAARWQEEALRQHEEAEQWRDAWRARGRELNELFDVLALAVDGSSTLDPIADLALLGASHAALKGLVALKDGPRDETYEQLKPLAWDVARLCVS
jgi:hypothetical protein